MGKQANAGSVHIKGGADENIHAGIELFERMRASVAACDEIIEGETDYRASLDEQIAQLKVENESLRQGVNKLEASYRQLDDILPPGRKSTAEALGSATYNAMVETGETMRAAINIARNHPHLVDFEKYKADTAGDTHGKGGAQIPQLVLPEIVRYMGFASLPRRMFNILEMENRSIDFPVKSSGPYVLWPGEAAPPWLTSLTPGTNPPLPTTGPTTGSPDTGFTAQGMRMEDPSAQLVAKVMMAVDKISMEYLEDVLSSQPITAVLTQLYLEAAADEETRVAFAGSTAANDPFNGIINTVGVASAGTVATGSAAAFTDLLKLNATVHDAVKFAPRGAFVCNTTAFFTKIMAMTSTYPIFVHNYGGNTIQNPYVVGGQPDPITAQPGMLLGRPLFLTPHLPPGTSAGQKFIMYADFSRAWMGRRRDIVVDYSQLPFWVSGATGIRLSQRIGFLYPQPTFAATLQGV